MVTSTLKAIGRIDTKVYDDESLPDDWGSLSDSEKLSSLRDVEPVESYTDYNTTVNGMHVYFAQNLDGSQSVDKDAAYLAVGDDDTAPTTSDSTLTNEVFRKQITDYSQTGNELLASTFIQSSEANGETFREVGLFAGSNPSDTMFNHSTISDIVKDGTRTITIDVTLQFTAQ